MESASTSAIVSAIDQLPITRVRNGLGGSHTVVTYPPLDSLSADIAPAEVEGGIARSRSLNVYLHVVFCEYVCAFCHYTKVYAPIGGQSDFISAYVNALIAEVHARAEILQASRVSSIYIGGGTPTSLSYEYLHRIVATLLDLVGEGVPRFCVETSPRSLIEDGGRSKIDRLIKLGVNRISVGVQTFNNDLLERYRGHERHIALEALDILSGLDVEWNLDLIQDLPGQTDQMIEEDLKFVRHYQPHQVTWYILRPETEAAWYKQVVRGSLTDLPSSRTSLLRRHKIIEGMRSLGYRCSEGGRFVRHGREDYYKAVRASASGELLGLGASAYSHGWGYFFRNFTDHKLKNGVQEYIQRIHRGESAIWKAARIDEGERRAGARVVSIRRVLTKEQLAGDDADAVTARRITKFLCDRDLLRERANGDYVITDLGLLYEEEMSSLMYSNKIKSILAARHRYWLAAREFTELRHEIGLETLVSGARPEGDAHDSV